MEKVGGGAEFAKRFVDVLAAANPNLGQFCCSYDYTTGYCVSG